MAIGPSFNNRFSYDVFLSFRGEDTRYGFTGNLCDALRKKGIHTFIDDLELEGGDEITPALEKAIEESRIFIVVFSQNYASSSFCLNELAHIHKFKEEKGVLVLPLFHNVDPSDVRHLTGKFGEALTNHVKKYDPTSEKLETWKKALNQVANLSGYTFKADGQKYEHKFMKEIVQFVSSKINRKPLHLDNDLVGLESKVLEVKALLDVGSDDIVHVVGIHGPGGMGKTTLAVAVYNSIADHFEALCYLADVRGTSKQHGLKHLQSILLSKTVGEEEIKITSVEEGSSEIKHRLQNKKILLILDDVDDIKQLEAIIGSSDWFGGGSRVIITTRNKQLLASHGVERTYKVKKLEKEDSLQLLSSKAFKLQKFDPCYRYVLNEAVTYASGLPLALKVIGSNLCGKPIEQWKSALNDYNRIPDKKIQEVLQVSYDGLGKEEQSVFLDISCCFKNYPLAVVKDILCAHYDGHCMQHLIDALVDKSLINISRDSRVTLHDLIEDMGQEIVRNESPEDPGKRSRLWFHEDIVEVLEDNKGTSQIEIINTDFGFFIEKVEWDGNAFKEMKNLKTLIIKGWNDSFSIGPKHLPNSLRVLVWRGYPSQDFPSDFHPRKLAICMLPSSKCTSSGFATLFGKKFMKLTRLSFNNCPYLTKIPDVSCLEGLKKLSFASCHNLLTVHESVGLLEKLSILEATGCRKLKSFPPIKLTSLEKLELKSCHSFENFPEVLAKMENVKYVSLESTSIKKLPESFQNLTGLEKLVLSHTKSRILKDAKESYLGDRGSVKLRGEETVMFILNISKMSKLAKITAWGLRGWQWPRDSLIRTVRSNVQYLILTDCNLSDEFFLIALPCFANVKELDLSENNFEIIPECFKEFCYLTSLTLNRCKSLQEIRGVPPNLKCFSAYECNSLTSSCKSMLLRKELHEGGYTNFCLTRAEIPAWFEHNSRGLPISFWVRKELPAIAICFHIASVDDYSLLEYEYDGVGKYFYKLKDGLVNSISKKRMDEGVGWGSVSLILIFNGNEHDCFTFSMDTNDTYLFDLREILRTEGADLTEIKKERTEDKLNEALLKNDWVNVQIIYKYTGERILMKSGIHVLKEQSREDIQFIDDPNSSEAKTLSVEMQGLGRRRESVHADVDVIPTMRCLRWPKSIFTRLDLRWPKSIFTRLDLPGLSGKKFKNLTNLNFDECQCLTEIPDVSSLQQLKKLSFQWCHNLLTIHESVGSLEKLKILKAKCACKLKSFPPIKLTSLEQLDLASCDSLESFPEILGKMENITKLNLDGTPINLTRLQQSGDMSSVHDAAIFLRNISMRPKEDESVENVSTTVSSNIQHLGLRNCNLLDDFFPIALQWFANVKELDLSKNNFRVIPESIKECRFLSKLTLERCRYLKEIRGVPPNLKHFSAIECLSLTSSSRSMLLDQELHEAGNTDFYLPGADIPEWFDCQTWGPPISFQFRNKFPAIAICFVRESADNYLLLKDEEEDEYFLSEDEDDNEYPVLEDEDEEVRLIVMINGYRHFSITLTMGTGTHLFDLKKLEDNLDEDEALFENEWSHAKIVYENKNYKSILVKSGIHVLKQQSSVEDIQFIDPQRKRKLEPQNQRLLKKQRLVDTEVADTTL